MQKHIIFSVLPYVWMGGLVLLLLHSLLQYQHLTKKLHNTAYLNTSCHIGNKTIPVWESDSLSTAFILGVFRLKIFLPSHLGEEERTFCLAHESTHIRRKDYLVKQFAYLLSCIYWFNPVIWIAYFSMTKDMEMSCDEAVLGRGELTVRKDYSNTLLNLASRQYRFGGSSYDVMKYKVSWKYLSEYGTYCYFYNPEETLSIEVECTGGYLDKETGLLILEYQSVHHDKLQGSVTLLFNSGNPENLYFIKNVIHNT